MGSSFPLYLAMLQKLAGGSDTLGEIQHAVDNPGGA
jgi:hypothetical protein